MENIRREIMKAAAAICSKHGMPAVNVGVAIHDPHPRAKKRQIVIEINTDVDPTGFLGWGDN